MVEKSGGTKAHNSGKRLEWCVSGLLIDAGYHEVRKGIFFAMREMKQPIFARECSIGKTIYGGNRKVDFILYHPTRWPDCLVIECKWQASSGSVYEKYPFLVLNIQNNNINTIIVLDGGGYTKGASNWLHGQAGKTYLKYVFNQGAFQKFVSKGGL
ncbi:PD-(D/E)XK nuclease superfamily protein [Candidatus Enterovibrio escicola]|nr:PD-(D/E)XK nuclease superfamily protein [Candidatus Enterovibrio escacola]